MLFIFQVEKLEGTDNWSEEGQEALETLSRKEIRNTDVEESIGSHCKRNILN